MNAAVAAPRAELIEIFSAIQGEGTIIGRRQIFVRFGRCDVKCVYCDTPLCHTTLSHFRVETEAGKRTFERRENPVGTDEISAFIARLDRKPGLHHSVSFTGGEPLLHHEAIVALAPSIRARGMAVYLETNGHLVGELERAMAAVDIVGMDIKLPSTAGFAERFAENERFLAAAIAARKEAFVKIVVGAATTFDEIDGAAQAVRRAAPATYVCLQPVTPFGGVGTPPTPERLLELHERALETLKNVVVIPQTHKMLRQL